MQGRSRLREDDAPHPLSRRARMDQHKRRGEWAEREERGGQVGRRERRQCVRGAAKERQTRRAAGEITGAHTGHTHRQRHKAPQRAPQQKDNPHSASSKQRRARERRVRAGTMAAPVVRFRGGCCARFPDSPLFAVRLGTVAHALPSSHSRRFSPSPARVALGRQRKGGGRKAARRERRNEPPLLPTSPLSPLPPARAPESEPSTCAPSTEAQAHRWLAGA